MYVFISKFNLDHQSSFLYCSNFWCFIGPEKRSNQLIRFLADASLLELGFDVLSR